MGNAFKAARDRALTEMRAQRGMITIEVTPRAFGDDTTTSLAFTLPREGCWLSGREHTAAMFRIAALLALAVPDRMAVSCDGDGVYLERCDGVDPAEMWNVAAAVLGGRGIPVPNFPAARYYTIARKALGL